MKPRMWTETEQLVQRINERTQRELIGRLQDNIDARRRDRAAMAALVVVACAWGSIFLWSCR